MKTLTELLSGLDTAVTTADTEAETAQTNSRIALLKNLLDGPVEAPTDPTAIHAPWLDNVQWSPAKGDLLDVVKEILGITTIDDIDATTVAKKSINWKIKDGETVESGVTILLTNYTRKGGTYSIYSKFELLGENTEISVTCCA